MWTSMADSNKDIANVPMEISSKCALQRNAGLQLLLLNSLTCGHTQYCGKGIQHK